ncbi:membrane fusion protein (multidrug efflux system) [Limnobacter thiooxidans]|uniref:Efflux RND transporter periplasmic adaptor subunit n=1 Tax=Limnobacter thiooxidans TaxID=131080 RepID=A0AA86J4E5_9BURK|nr:membrane fusion protein (multidrug efflux system) [Limnobacter thiooxidans]BET27511.1 efflux RND transporter periplasmic adaptor subunit [Limnobacter thiooxidans]
MYSNSLNSKQTQASPYSRSFAGVTFFPALLVTVLSTTLLLGCGSGADAQAPGGPAGGQPAPVPVVEVKTEQLDLVYEYPAQIAGLREVEIRARVAGIIERRMFEEGGRVKKGQSLYSLDNAPYQTALTRALADENSAKVRTAQAERDYKRVMPLAESKAVSQSELDAAQSAFEVAKADQQVASAAVRTARLNLEYARVQSPVNGFASRSQYSEGSFVSGPSELLTTVTQVDQVYVNFGIPEKDHEQLRKGVASGAVSLPNGDMVVEVLGADGEPMGLKAKLGFKDVRVNPATGTVDARAVLANDKEVLSPGQFVRVRISGAVQKDAVLLPQRAVLENPAGGKVVMTVSPENTVAPRPVEVAQWKGDQWVVTKGLANGDKVITDGFMKAPPGTPVKPVIAGDAAQAQQAPAQPAATPEATETKQ